MTDNISLFPKWKKDSTASEWLSDMSNIALKHPERFKRMVIIYEEDTADEKSFVRYAGAGEMTARELLGLIEQGKMQIHLYTRDMI